MNICRGGTAESSVGVGVGRLVAVRAESSFVVGLARDFGLWVGLECTVSWGRAWWQDFGGERWCLVFPASEDARLVLV